MILTKTGRGSQKELCSGSYIRLGQRSLLLSIITADKVIEIIFTYYANNKGASSQRLSLWRNVL